MKTHSRTMLFSNAEGLLLAFVFFLGSACGSSGEDSSSAESSARPPPPSGGSPIVYRGVICTACYWENVMVGDPNNPQNLAFAGVKSNQLYRSTNGGQSWTAEPQYQIIDLDNVNGLDPSWSLMDPKLIGRAGALSFIGMAYDWLNSTWRTYLVEGSYVGRLSGRRLPGRCHDRPRVSYDPDLNRNYISISHVTFTTEGTCQDQLSNSANTLFWTDNSGASFQYATYSQVWERPTTLAVPSAGQLYGASEGDYPYVRRDFWKFTSLQPLSIDKTLVTPGDTIIAIQAWTSNQHTREWSVFGGPEILIDRGARSKTRGRIYMIDAEAPTPAQGTPENYDIVVRYSDNAGADWSPGIRVNDDVGVGDQVFPSASLDANGTLHVAFVDHRNNQDQEVFDVYYTKSVRTKTGGISFKPNVKLTEAPVPIPGGSRPIGDYLDMVVGYTDRAYVAFPCGFDATQSQVVDACFVQVVL